MCDASDTVLFVSDPGEVLSVIPYLLGFHPAESVVALVVRCRVVELSARWDFPASVAGWEALREQLGHLTDRWSDAQAAVVVYASEGERARRSVEALSVLCEPTPLFAIATDGHRWWGSDGTTGRADASVGSTLIETQAIWHGMTAHTSRKALANLYSPLTTDGARHLAGARRRIKAEVSCRPVESQLSTLDGLDGGGELSDEELMRAGIIVGGEQAWIHAWRALRYRRAANQRATWHRVLALTHPGDAAPVFALVGIASWLAGDGAAAAICLAKGLDLCEGPMGGLEVLRLMIDAAIPPDQCDGIARALVE